MALKKEMFKELDRICKPGAILASNTSTLSIDEIASATSRPAIRHRHPFFQPRQCHATARDRARQSHFERSHRHLHAALEKLGKMGVLVGNCRGFVGNRMFGPYRREAQFLVEEGASIEAVDAALYGFGMAMGPLATGDLAGLDVGWRIRKEYRHLEHPAFDNRLPKIVSASLADTARKPAQAGTSMTSNRRPTPDPVVD